MTPTQPEAKQVEMKPIIFNSAMVQAILAGRKTQTRRIADVPNYIHEGTNIMDWGLSEHPYHKDGKWHYHVQTAVDDSAQYELKCRWRAGDVLYVRESVCAQEDDNGLDGVWYAADGAFIGIENSQQAADQWMDLRHYGKSEYRTVPSIHMPKWAARIFLKITDITVERLQDITEEDAQAEGAELYNNYDGTMGGWGAPCEYRAAFKSLWQSINGENSWAQNPFVWKISFERIDKPH